MDKKDILNLYRNYLYALQMHEEYGDKYGDTDELIRGYEEELKKHSISLVKKRRLSCNKSSLKFHN